MVAREPHGGTEVSVGVIIGLTTHVGTIGARYAVDHRG